MQRRNRGIQTVALSYEERDDVLSWHSFEFNIAKANFKLPSGWESVSAASIQREGKDQPQKKRG
ncbi:MAG TPA: hypothetical protein VGL72_17805 [Bryobacteraceae bacterium]